MPYVFLVSVSTGSHHLTKRELCRNGSARVVFAAIANHKGHASHKAKNGELFVFRLVV